MSLQRAFFDFSHWSVMPDPEHADRLAIELSEAEDFTDELCHATAGFITCLAGKEPTHSGSRWDFARPEHGRILLRMDRSFSDGPRS